MAGNQQLDKDLEELRYDPTSLKLIPLRLKGSDTIVCVTSIKETLYATISAKEDNINGLPHPSGKVICMLITRKYVWSGMSTHINQFCSYVHFMSEM